MASVIEKSIRKAVTASIGAAANFNRKRLDYGNAFLTGIHTPMAEEATLEDLRVTGVIPSELDGRYVRIGPNPLHSDGRGHHWFVGDGMVHGVRLRKGRAEWYRNRWIRSNELAGKAGLDAAPGPRRGPSDNVNTNIVQLGNQTLAMVEAGSYPVVLSDELESVAYSDFGGGLAGSFTAHPHHDLATGEWHAICYDAMAPNRITHVALDGSGKVLRELPIAVEHGPSIHDCALTPNFVVILDLPVTFSMGSLIGGYRFPYRWNRQHQARVGLLPRDGAAADVTWHPVDPCYSFHVGNSFEDAKGRVVIDLCVYETMFDGDLTGPFGKSLGLERWTVDPHGGAVTRRTLDAKPQEFPRPDERFFGKDYRFLWSIESREGDADFFGHAPIVRHDLAAGTRKSRSFGDHAVPGEFVFVPRSDDALEGEGWLMGYVIDRALDTTDLAILDATTLEDVARVHIPHRIPPGFHGNWMPAN